MNEKLTLDDLSNYIMLKHNITKDTSERFLANFLKVIGEGLVSDRYVRIKGFGTFKLIEDNIDVNHSFSKIVFVPESALKDAVNKPFAHFESIILNENVYFDDVEEHVLSNNPVSEAEVEENIGNNIVETEICTNHFDKDEHKIDEGKDDDLLNGVKSNSDEIIKLEDKVSTISCNHNVRWYIILIIGFLLGASVSWLVLENKTLETECTSISGNNSTEDSDVEHVAKAVMTDSAAVNPETFVENSTSEYDIVEKTDIDSILKVADIEKKENENRDINVYSEKLNYMIVGTIESHVIKKGSTLAKIAYKYYKNKKMWPYIVMHNKEKIKDPNNVPIGTEINIPKLEAIK